MKIERSLIIQTYWLDKMLSGEKTWEMRSTGTNIRGPIGLIESGSGLIVGTATLDGCGNRLTDQELIDTISYHGLSKTFIQCVENKWNTPWFIGNAARLANPIPYIHPKGAVIWVKTSLEI